MSLEKILILVIFCAFWAGCTKQNQEVYIYRDNKAGVMLVIKMANQEITDGHLVSSFLLCDKPLLCVRSQLFTFGVSAERLDKKEWDIDKYKYRVASVKSGPQANNKIYTIVGERNGERWEYIYDSTRGLVGMKTHAPNRTVVEFNLETNCGFAHATECVQKN